MHLRKFSQIKVLRSRKTGEIEVVYTFYLDGRIWIWIWIQIRLGSVQIMINPIPDSWGPIRIRNISNNKPVMVLTTGVSATAGMLPVLANATVTVGNVAAQLPGLLLARGHTAQAFLQSETTQYFSLYLLNTRRQFIQPKYWNHYKQMLLFLCL